MNQKDQQWRELIRKVFELYDKDKSGYLDRGEAHELIKRVEKSLNDPSFRADQNTVNAMFVKMDKNNDNKISFEELYDTMKHLAK